MTEMPKKKKKGKYEPLEMFKGLKFRQMVYAHKKNSPKKNLFKKVIWNFDIWTNHPIPTKWPNLILIN